MTRQADNAVYMMLKKKKIDVTKLLEFYAGASHQSYLAVIDEPLMCLKYTNNCLLKITSSIGYT